MTEFEKQAVYFLRRITMALESIADSAKVSVEQERGVGVFRDCLLANLHAITRARD